jgi:hypothetical protein
MGTGPRVPRRPGRWPRKITIAGLHHGERGTIMHLLVTGVALEGDWPYAWGVRPLPVLWIRDSHGRWHATRLDGVSPWGDNGANPWTDTSMVTVWLRIIPPLDRDTAWIEISATGRSAQVRAPAAQLAVTTTPVAGSCSPAPRGRLDGTKERPGRIG